MGTDFLYAICPLPPSVSEKTRGQILDRIYALSESAITDMLDNFHYDWKEEVNGRTKNLSEEHLFKVDCLELSFKKEILLEMLNNALEEVVFSRDRRDVGELVLGKKLWVISGGMSYGEAPCEAMTFIDLLDASGVLEGLNDYR